MEINREKIRGKIEKWMIALVSFIILGAVILQSYKIIETGNVGVKKTLGQIDKEELKPGIHFVIPFIQQIEDVFTKTIMINYTDVQKRDSKEIYYEKSLSGEDTTGLEMKVDLIVEVDPQPDKMADMYISVGREGFAKKVLQPIRGIVRRVLGQYNAENIMSKRKQVERDIRHELEAMFNRNPYYKLINMQLKKIYLPKKVSEAIEKVQLAKQHAKEQQQMIVANEAKAQSTIALAKGKAESLEIQAKAEAKKITIKADAQAKANLILAKSLTPELLKLKAILAWEKGGSLVPKIVTGGSNPMTLLLNDNNISK